MNAPGVRIVIDLLDGRYDATVASATEEGEWPPAPSRMFSALVAAAGGTRTEAEAEALRWLETRQPPQIYAPHDPVREEVPIFQPVGLEPGPERVTPTGGRKLMWERSAVPHPPVIAFEYPDPPAGVTAALDGLCQRLDYFGRSTSMATFSINPPGRGDVDGIDTWAPVDKPTRRSVRVRVPYDGLLDRLDTAHRNGGFAWLATERHKVTYAPVATATEPGADVDPPGQYELRAVWQFDRHLPGKWALGVARAFRGAYLTHIPAGGDPMLTGHRKDDQDSRTGVAHVAFLPLPRVADRHAAGELQGLAVASPIGLSADADAVLDAALQALSGDWTLTLPGGVELTPRRVEVDRPISLSRRSWTGPARRWVTATPVVPDGFPKGRRPDRVVKAVHQSLQCAGFEPDHVTIGPSALRTARFRREDLGDAHQPRPVHAYVTFPEPMTGPVIAGRLRHFGVGLFLPIPDEEAA